tara:strand:+ start:189 stop:1139 length:951 start_codon:yes stop_codon:yes gene_type:complete
VKIKILILTFCLTINLSCVENVITIHVLPDGQTFLQIVSTGDSTDILDSDFKHPIYENQNSLYKVIKSDSVWKSITKIMLKDSVFSLKPEHGLSYDFKIQKSATSISNIYRFKMNFIGREIKTEYPLLYKAMKSNNLDSLIWLPEALTVIIDKAISDLENNQKFKGYDIDRPRLVNHFKNSFSRISTFEKLQDIQNDRRSYIQNTLKPFKLNKDFSDDLSKSMKSHEDRLRASLGLQDDNFIIKLLLPGNPISGNAMSMTEDTLIWRFGLDSLLDTGFNLYAESVMTTKDKLQKTTVVIMFFLLIISIILIKKQNQ